MTRSLPLLAAALLCAAAGPPPHARRPPTGPSWPRPRRPGRLPPGPRHRRGDRRPRGRPRRRQGARASTCRTRATIDRRARDARVTYGRAPGADRTAACPGPTVRNACSCWTTVRSSRARARRPSPGSAAPSGRRAGQGQHTVCVTGDGLVLRNQCQDPHGRRSLVEATILRLEPPADSALRPPRRLDAGHPGPAPAPPGEAAMRAAIACARLRRRPRARPAPPQPASRRDAPLARRGRHLPGRGRRRSSLIPGGCPARSASPGTPPASASAPSPTGVRRSRSSTCRPHRPGHRHRRSASSCRSRSAPGPAAAHAGRRPPQARAAPKPSPACLHRLHRREARRGPAPSASPPTASRCAAPAPSAASPARFTADLRRLWPAAPQPVHRPARLHRRSTRDPAERPRRPCPERSAAPLGLGPRTSWGAGEARPHLLLTLLSTAAPAAQEPAPPAADPRRRRHLPLRTRPARARAALPLLRRSPAHPARHAHPRPLCHRRLPHPHHVHRRATPTAACWTRAPGRPPAAPAPASATSAAADQVAGLALHGVGDARTASASPPPPASPTTASCSAPAAAPGAGRRHPRRLRPDRRPLRCSGRFARVQRRAAGRTP